MIGMDSGNGHLAAMFGVTVLTIWGVTHPYAGFVPFGQPEANQLIPDLEKFPKIPTSIYGNKVPNGYEDAMLSIPVEKITKRAIQIIEA
jgi:ADP-heptose:LPS heptosyltransferase